MHRVDNPNLHYRWDPKSLLYVANVDVITGYATTALYYFIRIAYSKDNMTTELPIEITSSDWYVIYFLNK